MSTKPLQIKDWNLGIGESPYVGFGQMVNVDIFTKPGSVLISNRMTRDVNSVGIVNELIIWTAQDPRTGDTYGVDRGGTLYKRDAGTTVWSVIAGHGGAGALGQGLAIWNDYLFYARSNRIDLYALPSSPNGDAGTWYNNWVGVVPILINSFTHPMLNAMDGHLYIGNAEFVDTLQHLTTTPFAPNNSSTYSYNSPQLKLNPNYIVSTLEDYNGVGVSIGTLYGFNGDFNIADTFFWDGASDTYTTPGTTRFADNGVRMMKNIGGVYFTIAGTGTPRIFKSVSAQAVEARRFNNVGPGNVTLFAAAINQKDGEILFGIGQSQGAGGTNPMGVYSLRPNSATGSAAYVTRYKISTGNDGSNGVLMIGSISLLSADEIMVTWYDSRDPDTFGVDVLDVNSFYTGYSAYIESPLYTVGTADDPATFEKIQLSMGKPLKTGDGVRISARKNLFAPYVLVADFNNTYTGYDTIDAKVQNISKFKTAQFKIELTTASNSVESPELKEITLT